MIKEYVLEGLDSILRGEKRIFKEDFTNSELFFDEERYNEDLYKVAIGWEGEIENISWRSGYICGLELARKLVENTIE